MRLPAIFVGHGTPMNAIENNAFTENWQALGKKISPKAILMVSAHWFTRGTFTQDSEKPRVINDMYGFPKELYEVNYQVDGDKALSDRVMALLSDEVAIEINNNWGIDHGTWSVLTHMYPDRNIPVVQLSIDGYKSPEAHFAMGKKLAKLREEGYLVMGSGNVVHNLRLVDFGKTDGYSWAYEFDNYIRDAIVGGEFDKCINYKAIGDAAKYAVPTTDHYDPLLYVLGAAMPDDKVSVFNEESVMGSMSMTSYIFE